jgi:hypothetical protein
MNFFHHKDLGNHTLQLCPKVVKHPVYICMYYVLVVYFLGSKCKGNSISVLCNVSFIYSFQLSGNTYTEHVEFCAQLLGEHPVGTPCASIFGFWKQFCPYIGTSVVCHRRLVTRSAFVKAEYTT